MARKTAPKGSARPTARQAADGLRIVSAPATTGIEEIAPRTPSPHRNGPRGSGPPGAEAGTVAAPGLRTRPNPDEQRREVIAPAPPPQRPEDPEIAHKKLFTRFEAAFMSQDIDELRACLSPAFQWHPPAGPAFFGREEALAEMARRFALPDGPRFTGSVWRFKDTTVIQTYEVAHRGPDGALRQVRGMDIYEIGGGLITRKDAFWKLTP